MGLTPEPANMLHAPKIPPAIHDASNKETGLSLRVGGLPVSLRGPGPVPSGQIESADGYVEEEEDQGRH